jgi:predicted Zn-dependent protease
MVETKGQFKIKETGLSELTSKPLAVLKSTLAFALTTSLILSSALTPAYAKKSSDSKAVSGSKVDDIDAGKSKEKSKSKSGRDAHSTGEKSKSKKNDGAESAIARDTIDTRPKVLKEENGRVFLSKDENDVLFEALTDEMKRSTDKLKLGTHGLPYFVQYKVLETEMLYLSASCGALTSENNTHYRRLYTDIRVGDYDLDSSKDSGSMSSLFGRLSGSGKELPVEDDYAALRHEIWLASDSNYKDAIEGYEDKKARLRAKPESDRLGDMTKETPVVFIKPALKLKVDKDKWKKVTKDLSAIFLKYPEIDNAVVHFSSQVSNAWLVNNEGFKHRDGHIQTLLSVLAKIRSKDGQTYADVEIVAAENPDEMPDYATLESRVDKLVKRLKRTAEAPLVTNYTGPMLFEPEASSSLMHSALTKLLGGAHDVSGSSWGGDHPFKNKLGQRVGARIISVVDDPYATEFKGKKLFGNYEVDDDGVPAEKLTLIERGVLKTLCASRKPTRGVTKSNGHSGDGTGTVSILFVSTEPSMNPKQMKKKLIELGKEQGYDDVYIVRSVARLPTWMLSLGSTLSSIFSSFGGGLSLYPTEIYRVSVKNGKEELVRGATVSVQPGDVLRELVAGGSDVTASIVAQGPTSATSIVTPSIILRDVDIKEPSKASEKLPVVPSPVKEQQQEVKEDVKSVE